MRTSTHSSEEYGITRKLVGGSILFSILIFFLVYWASSGELWHSWKGDETTLTSRANKPELQRSEALPRPYGVSEFQSYGFYSVPEKEWQLRLRKWAGQQPLQQKRQAANMANHRWFQFNWEPDWACRLEDRIGPMGIGGKWVCDPHKLIPRRDGYPSERADDRVASKGYCLVYSFSDVTKGLGFETELHEKTGCEIHVFDVMANKTTVVPPFLHLHNYGLGMVGESPAGRAVDGGVYDLSSIVSLLGHEKRTIEILKMDSKGGLYNHLTPVLKQGMRRELVESRPKPWIRQILLELHSSVRTAHELLKSATESGYVIFHKEPNTLQTGGANTEYSLLQLNLNSEEH